MRTQMLTIRSDGSIESLGDPAPEIAAMGAVTRTRISHIRPLEQPKRGVFILLRLFFGDRGKVAAWTRTWKPARWEVQFIGRPERAEFKSRDMAMLWEELMAEKLVFEMEQTNDQRK